MNYYKSSGQMDLTDRVAIETGLCRGESFKKIAKRIGRHPSTIAHEVMENRTYIKGTYYAGKDCRHVRTCAVKNLCWGSEDACNHRCKYCRGYDCTKMCDRYVSAACHKPDKPLYVCNTCKDRKLCIKDKYVYSAPYADAAVSRRRSESRQGIRLTDEQKEFVDELVTRLVKKGQPLTHIYAEHEAEMPMSLRSLYNYIDAGELTIKNIDLRRKTSYRQRCVYVAIGAPITEYEKIRKERNAYFNSILPTDRWVECRYEGRTYQFIVKRSVVCPETVAAFVYNAGNDKGNMILVDIGGNNIQYVCSTNGVINFDRAKTFTAKGGVNTFARRIRMLMEQNQIEPVGTVVEIIEWLANPKSIPGKYENNWKERFKELVDAEKKTYFSLITGILDTVTGNFREEMLRGYKVCYTGGGSVLFKSEIKVSGGITFDGNEYANVLGFYKMLS